MTYRRGGDGGLLARSGVAAIGALAAMLTLAVAAAAHEPPRPVVRELVRIQGYRDAPREGVEARELQLVANGRSYRFYATDWQQYAPTARSAPTQAAPQEFLLQASHEILARFSGARAEQRVTILGEWRPGRKDLFVLALDLCPPE